MDSLQQRETLNYLYYLAKIGIIDTISYEKAIRGNGMEWVVKAKHHVWRLENHEQISAFNKGVQTFATFVGNKEYKL